MRFFYLASNQIVKDLNVHHWSSTVKPRIPDSHKRSCESLPDAGLVTPNRALAGYSRWHDRLDAFVTLRATDPLFVMRWRVEAEAGMAALGRPALDRAAIEDYVRRFLPAYALYASGPGPVPDANLLLFLDAERRAVAAPGTMP